MTSVLRLSCGRGYSLDYEVQMNGTLSIRIASEDSEPCESHTENESVYCHTCEHLHCEKEEE
jgi:hypothetical protein